MITLDSDKSGKLKTKKLRKKMVRKPGIEPGSRPSFDNIELEGSNSTIIPFAQL